MHGVSSEIKENFYYYFSVQFDVLVDLWTCIFFRESLTWRDAVRAVIPRKSP